MKPLFQHKATTSFAMWFNNFLLRKGEAYSNKTGTFFYQEDDRLDPNYISYASPYKQWVFDSSITGASIPSGVYVDGNFVERGETGLKIDFDNGRVLFSGDYVDANRNITGSFAVNDINIYLTDETEENLIVENKYDLNSRFKQGVSGITPYNQVVPAAFISMQKSQNVPLAFGGEDQTNLSYRIVGLAENLYQLDGIISLCTDSSYEVFPDMTYMGYPLNEFGDLKTGGYNYVNSANEKIPNQNVFMVDTVYASKISDRVTNRTNPGLFLGFIDFDIAKFRYPRSDP